MWRSLGIVIALAAHAQAEPTACSASDKYEAAAAAAAKTNEARFRDVLARKRLATPKLPVASWPEDAAARGVPQDVVEKRTANGHRASYVLVGYSTCEPGYEFARDGAKFYRIVRTPTAGSVTKVGTICGCGPNRTRGCAGGKPKPVLVWGYELPPGTTYAGVMTITYVEDRVDASFQDGRCPPPP